MSDTLKIELGILLTRVGGQIAEACQIPDKEERAARVQAIFAALTPKELALVMPVLLATLPAALQFPENLEKQDKDTQGEKENA